MLGSHAASLVRRRLRSVWKRLLLQLSLEPFTRVRWSAGGDMTVSGSCLCGGVRFEIDQAVGPFEICHCNRCRKTSGGVGLPMLRVETRYYRMLQGQELVQGYEAPILYRPPAYHASFCSRCGSPVPPAEPEGDTFEIAAGLLDDDPKMRPDKHIFVEFLPAWDAITDGLPEYTIDKLYQERRGVPLPEGFTLKRHGEGS